MKSRRSSGATSFRRPRATTGRSLRRARMATYCLETPRITAVSDMERRRAGALSVVAIATGIGQVSQDPRLSLRGRSRGRGHSPLGDASGGGSLRSAAWGGRSTRMRGARSATRSLTPAPSPEAGFRARPVQRCGTNSPGSRPIISAHAGSGLSPHRLRHPEGSGLLGDRTHLSDESSLLLLRNVRHCDVDNSPKDTDELALVQNQVPLTYVKERTSGSNPIGLGVR